MTDLDDALRSTLRTRELDITSVPADLFDRDMPEASAVVRRPWPLVAAAAAIVVLAAGIVVAIARSGGDTKRAPASVPGTCAATTVPAAWLRALDAGRTSAAMPLAALADGSLVEISQTTLLLRTPSGRTRQLAVFPSGNPLVTVDGTTSLVALQGASSVQVFDARGGSGGFDIRGHLIAAAVQDGIVYYQTDFGGGQVRDYDIARDEDHVLYRGADANLSVSPGLAVRWNGGIARKKLPADLRRALAGAPYYRIFYQGGTYARPQAGGLLLISATGTVSGPYLRGAKYHLRDIAGPYVLISKSATDPVQVFDTTTHALLDTHLHGSTVAGGDVFAVTTGHRTTVVNATRLPHLHC